VHNRARVLGAMVVVMVVRSVLNLFVRSIVHSQSFDGCTPGVGYMVRVYPRSGLLGVPYDRVRRSGTRCPSQGGIVRVTKKSKKFEKINEEWCIIGDQTRA
jgi:hypothetical protein